MDHSGGGDLGVDTTYSPCVAAGRTNDLPWPVLSGQTRELGEGERRKIYLSIALWRTLSPPPPLPAARTISFPLWAALVPSRRQRRRPRGAEPQSRLAARRAVDPDRAMGPTALPLSLTLCRGPRRGGAGLTQLRCSGTPLLGRPLPRSSVTPSVCPSIRPTDRPRPSFSPPPRPPSVGVSFLPRCLISTR